MSYQENFCLVAPPEAHFPNFPNNSEEDRYQDKAAIRAIIVSKIKALSFGFSSTQANYSADIVEKANKNRDIAPRAALYSRLNSYAGYEHDWDGEGANAIEKPCVDNVKQLIDNLPLSFINNIKLGDLFPTPNGTITIEIGGARRYFVIDIGNTTVLYYYRIDDFLAGIDESVVFSKEVITEISKLFVKFSNLGKE